MTNRTRARPSVGPSVGRSVGRRRRREGTDGTHRDGTNAGDGEDGRIDRADVISSIGSAAREDAGGGDARRSWILILILILIFDLISSGAIDEGRWGRRCERRWIGR